MVFVTIFIVTLQRLIGRNCFGDDGFLHLGIRAMKVLFKLSGDLPSLRTFQQYARTFGKIMLEARLDPGLLADASGPPIL
jgi:hypothetical protein